MESQKGVYIDTNKTDEMLEGNGIFTLMHIREVLLLLDRDVKQADSTRLSQCPHGPAR